MSRSCPILAILLFCGFSLLRAHSQQPADAAHQTNPVHPTPASLARAKDIYTFDCALCHGGDGGGKGDFSTDTKLKDYRDPSALKDLSDGAIFDIIDQGKGSMPPEHGRAKPDEIWNLVIYLRSLSKGPAAAASQASGPA